jgi:hypothetical protein
VPLSAASGQEWSTREGGVPAPQVKIEFKNGLISLQWERIKIRIVRVRLFQIDFPIPDR